MAVICVRRARSLALLRELQDPLIEVVREVDRRRVLDGDVDPGPDVGEQLLLGSVEAHAPDRPLLEERDVERGAVRTVTAS